jgi:hypothetical protein
MGVFVDHQNLGYGTSPFSKGKSSINGLSIKPCGKLPEGIDYHSPNSIQIIFHLHA